MQMNTKMNAFDALFHLVWILLKRSWMILLGILIVSIFFLTLPVIVITNNDWDCALNYGSMGLGFVFPVLSINLILLPIINEKIYSSSIKKRLKASGVPMKIYSIVIMIVFTLVSLIIFYTLMIIVLYSYQGDNYRIGWDDNISKPIYGQWYYPELNWLSILLLAPISIMGLSATGLLISRMRFNELIKGIGILIFIVVIIFMSRTVFNPYNSDMLPYPVGSNVLIDSDMKKIETVNTILFLNPWSTLIWTMESTILTPQFTSIADHGWADYGIEIFNNIKPWYSYVYSFIFSITIIVSTIFTSK